LSVVVFDSFLINDDLIADRFIPFKTPLCEEFADQIDNPGLMFPPTMLLDSNPRIKLWINLTYTDRFYNREDIESRGVTFKKLACRGFGETPTEEQTSEFIRIVQAFVQKNPNDLIAVHCTHGFNRTGFLICSFLCQIDSWDINAAVAEFSRARSPGIYKEEYLKKLFELYGDPEDCPSPPVLPDWCHEEDEEADDVHDKNHRSNNQGFSRDFTNKNPAFMKGVDGVTPILEVRELFRIRQKIKAFVGYNGNGFPGAQPVSMMNANLRYLVEKKYRVSWKADGTRYMLLIEGKDQCYFADRDFSVFKIHNLTFFSAQNYPEHLQDTLLDGEMVIDDYQSQKTPRFLIYDIIVHDQTEKLGLKDFDQRLGAIEKLIIQPRNRGIQEGLIDRSKESFGVRMKGFWDISKTKDVMRMKTGHDHDGLIFQPVPDPYTPGTCPYILKWKPSELNTIDFKCRIQKTQQPGCLPETRAMLYVNGLDSPFAAMKVVKSNRDEWMKYDGKIVECECLHLESNQWKVMRERTDKSHPNAYKTAISVIESIKDKLDEPTLLSYIEQLLARQSGW
jgi:mRNA-capping enzyme